MKLQKNLEAIVLVAVALTFSGAALAAPAPRAAAAPSASIAKMIKVVIKGKRLSAAQKAQLS